VNLVGSVQSFVLLLLGIGSAGLTGYAFADVLRRKGTLFPHVGRLSKGAWLGILSWGNTCGSGDAGVFGTTGAGLLVTTGGWLIAHAIWSYADVDPNTPLPVLSIGPDGGELAVIGVF